MRLTYRVYRLASGLRFHVPRHLTPAGTLLLCGIALAASASFDMDRSVAYQALALIAGLLLTAFLSKWFFRGRFQITRQLPRFASVGQPFRYGVRVRNDTRRAYRDLEVFEDLADPRPTWPEFREWTQGAEPARPFCRWPMFGSARPREFRRALVGQAALPALGPGGVAEALVEATPLRRGVLRFEGASIGRPDALGLVRGFIRVRHPESVLVLPRRYPLPAIALDGVRQYQPGGVALAAAIGESEEFISLRDYRPGDPLRQIHWRSWARTGRPIVRECQDEFVARYALILDTFARPSQEEAFEEAVSIAASFACTMDTQESLLDLLFVGPEAICFTTGRALGQAERALEVLAAVQRNRSPSFEALRRLVLQHARLVAGCVAVFVAWDEPRRELVRQLRSQGKPVLTLVVGPPPADGDEAGTAGQTGPVHFLEPRRIAEGLARLEGAG